MASSTKMTLSINQVEANLILEALKSYRSNCINSVQYDMNRIQKNANVPFNSILKPAKDSPETNRDWVWDNYYVETDKINCLNSLLNEFGVDAKLPFPDDLTPEPVLEPTSEVS